MGATPAMPLSEIVDVVVMIAPQVPSQPTFNQGLIVGPTTVIPSWGVNSRLRQYTTLSQILSDGFATTDPMYIAAQLYFSQVPSPPILWLGVQDVSNSSIMTALIGTDQGSGYVVGDLLTVTGGGGNNGVLKVTSIGNQVTGNVETVAIVQDGTGYASGTDLATTTNGAGSGVTVNITVGSETLLQAVEYCRAYGGAWYGVYCIGAAQADHQALAAFAQAAQPPTIYFYQTSDTAVLNNAPGNVMANLKANKYSRVIGIYSTTQGGVFPNNAYAGAALMGMAFGLNSGLAQSYYTLMFRTMAGVAFEPLTQTQVETISGIPGEGTGLNGNLYVNYANVYQFIQQGVMADGQYFDEVVNIDMLSSDLQFSVMNLFISNNSIPQTDPGEGILIHAVNQAAQRAVTRGFIAPGVWNGVQILQLFAGDPLPSGYKAQAQPYSQQSTSDRQARKAMPIYLAILEAGGVQSLLIGVYVQR